MPLNKSERTDPNTHELASLGVTISEKMTEQDIDTALDVFDGRFSGDNDALIEQLREIISHCRRLNYEKGLVNALSQLAFTLGITRGWGDNVLEISLEGIQLAQRLGLEEDEADFLNQLGIHAANNDKFEESRKYYEGCLTLYRKLELPDKTASVLHNLARRAFAAGESFELASYLLEISKVLPSVKSVHVRASCLIRLGVSLFEDFDFSGAQPMFAEAVRLSDEAGDDNMSIRSRLWLGRGHFERSELEEAMRLWTEAEELCIRNNIWGDRVQAFRGYARVFLKQGRPHAAQEKLSEALQIASKLPEYQRLSVLMDLVRPLSELGNSEEAIKVAEEVRTYYEQPTNAAKLLGAYRACVEAYIGAGDRNKALEYHDLLRKSERRFFDEQYRNGLKASEAKLELERERSETQMQALKAEQYEQQLSNSTLQLVAQTELLTELRDGLLQFIRKFPLPDGAAKELRERLKTLTCK
ncbi:MAG TPA: tetratricopeptide repeat protein [Candidatus Kapabacteria bacterium]|nr:tetratricopeptide repeat protein [Candidatus Kapabacteria bacterium]